MMIENILLKSIPRFYCIRPYIDKNPVNELTVCKKTVANRSTYLIAHRAHYSHNTQTVQATAPEHTYYSAMNQQADEQLNQPIEMDDRDDAATEVQEEEETLDTEEDIPEPPKKRHRGRPKSGDSGEKEKEKEPGQQAQAADNFRYHLHLAMLCLAVKDLNRALAMILEEVTSLPEATHPP